MVIDHSVTRQRRSLGYVLLVLAILPLMFNTIGLLDHYQYNPQVISLSTLIWMVCSIPLIIYLVGFDEKSKKVPFFEVFSFLHGFYYSLPVLIVDPKSVILWIDPIKGYTVMMEYVLWGVILMVLGYYSSSRLIFPTSPTKVWIADGFSNLRDLKRNASITIIFVFVVSLIEENIEVGVEFVQPIGAIKNCGQLAEAILLYYFFKSKLEKHYFLVMLFSLTTRLVIALTSGLVANLIVIFVSLGLIFWVAKMRISFTYILLIVVLSVGILLLKGVIGDYRKEAWSDNQVQLTRLEKLDLIIELLDGLSIGEQYAQSPIEEGFDAIFSRSNLPGTFAYVWQMTPRVVPYWDGGSYKSILTFFIPRLLWSDKPVSSNGQAFGHRYAILDTHDTRTSVNLPVMIEFFVNFSEQGILFGMILLGVFCALIEYILLASAQDSLDQLIGVILLYPLFNIESDLSLIIAGLFFNIVTLKFYAKYFLR
jgi:hypothetical protein